MVRSVDVAIVGGGPAGLVLALMLARSGRSVEVIERNATFDREYRGEGIQPGTRRIFTDLGLGARIDALDRGSPRGLRARIDGRERSLEFAPFVGDDPNARPAFIPQPLLLDVLADAAREAGAALTMATRFKAVRRPGFRVSGIEAVGRDGDADIAARVIVGCDGRFSAVRRSLGVPVRESRVPYDVLWFSAQAPGAANDLVYLEARGREVAIAFPSRRRTMQVGWLLEKGSFAGEPDRAFADLRRELIARAPREAKEALERELLDRAQLSLLPVASEHAQRWWIPGALLIGDAAHPMSPVAAQGINVAVQDAVVAARHLAPALDAGDDAIDRALLGIESERRGPVTRIARQQNALLIALHALGPARFLRAAIALVTAGRRTGLVPFLGRPLLDRFLWGDPPIRATSGPWNSRRGLPLE